MKSKKLLKVTFIVKVPIVIEEADDIEGYYAECPPLEIISQGGNKREAEKNIKDAVEAFLFSCFERGTLNDVLKECGFKPVQGTYKSTAFKGTRNTKSIDVPLPLTVNC